MKLSSRSAVASLLAVVVSLAPSAAALADKTPLTSLDLFKLRAVTSATISPNGLTIAYTLSVPRDPLHDKDGASFSELWVVGPDGPPRPFVTGEVNVGDVQFSGDGKQLAFLAKRTGDKNRALYLLPLDGGEARKVVEVDTDVIAFALHPTLFRVALITAAAPNKPKKAREEKGFNQEVFEEEWAPAQLVIDDWNVPVARPRTIAMPGHPSEVHWSPDGLNLIVAVAPTPSVDDSYMNKQLRVFELKTGQEVAKVEHAGKLGMSTISVDGKLIAAIASVDEHDPQPGRLEVAHAFGGPMHDVLPDWPGHFVSCAFLGSDALVYLADRGCETVLGKVGVDGTGNTELFTKPGFVVTSLAVVKNGVRAALIVQTPEQPPELYGWDLKPGHAPSRLTNSNPWLDQRKFAAQETIKWKARDDLELEGVLIHPLDQAPGTKPETPYPLLVVVHGGPESHMRDGWLTNYSNPGQVAAANGYAVFYPNYRGSTGRGVAFSMLDHKDPAGKEFDDLVDGVDALIAQGLVDRAKVGVTGGSYGGYASAWCATKYSARFAASVMGFGVSDLLSMLGTSDIPTEHYLVHHRVHPWEDWQLFLDRSPIFHTKEAKTPTLILCGKADPRVPPSQSMELYRYMQQCGNPAVRLVSYPGEGHGNSRAASRMDYHLRMMQWFDHYLKGSGGAPPAYDIDAAAMLTRPAAPSATPPAPAQPPAPTPPKSGS